MRLQLVGNWLNRLATNKKKNVYLRRALSIVHLFVEEITHALSWEFACMSKETIFALQSIASAAFQSPYPDILLHFCSSLRNKEAEARESAVHTLSTHCEPGFKRSVAFTVEFQVAPKGPWNARGWKLYASSRDLGIPSRFPTVTTVFSCSTTTRVYTHVTRFTSIAPIGWQRIGIHRRDPHDL